MNRVLQALLLAGLVLALAQPVGADYFNGASSWASANKYDAPIFRQFAFVEGTVTQYHVLKPGIFRTDNHRSDIYQFPLCPDLMPVLERHAPDHDAPTRRIVDVTLSTGCDVQPQSRAEVMLLAGVVVPRVVQVEWDEVLPREMWVNAPKIPAALQDVPDDVLFNGPPYRPRIPAYEEGELVKFITYEVNWLPTWMNTNFPATDADVFIISYGPIYIPGYTVLNVAAGTPVHTSAGAYSPIWRANCIVTHEDPTCGTSVHQPDYGQCYSVAECLAMPGVTVTQPPDFTHINCPMVATDLNGDMHISEQEDFFFPTLWKDGPVTIV